jgi:prepilin-type N-terminal cleavage/methylation domain-containing protein
MVAFILNLLFFYIILLNNGDIKEMKKTVLIKNIKSKKGFSLLELLLVLGIIAALVVAAFIVYPKVQASQRAQAESNNIATIQAGVKALYTSASSFTGLTNLLLFRRKYSQITC